MLLEIQNHLYPWLGFSQGIALSLLSWILSQKLHLYYIVENRSCILTLWELSWYEWSIYKEVLVVNCWLCSWRLINVISDLILLLLQIALWILLHQTLHWHPLYALTKVTEENVAATSMLILQFLLLGLLMLQAP